MEFKIKTSLAIGTVFVVLLIAGCKTTVVERGDHPDHSDHRDDSPDRQDRPPNRDNQDR
jgi:hypothetical protein